MGRKALRQPTTAHVSTLRDYLQVARRRKWIILLTVVLVPLAAVAFSLRQPAHYQASADVLLSQQDLASQLIGTSVGVSLSSDRDAQTQAALARLPTVAQSAIDATHVHMSAGAFLGNSSVSPATSSDIMTFSFGYDDARIAQLMATAYARAYVRYRLSTDTAAIVTALHEVEGEIAKLGSHGSLYATLVDKATQLRTLAALKTANASVIRSADGAAQTAPRTRRNGALGLILGLFLGIGLAFLREALDTRVRSAEAIGDQLHLPLLARLSAPAKKLRAEMRLAMLDDPTGAQAEAFRVLRTNFEFASLGKEARIVMVTSAIEQEGKSTTIANLAVALARGGRHVVLVDLDLRRPSIDSFFGLEGDRPGLTQVAIGSVPLGKAIVRVPIVGDDAMLLPSVRRGENGNGRAYVGCLDVLPSGPLPPDPGEFVGTGRLTEILEHLRDHSDIVLIDAPPLFHVGDGLVLSSKVDAVLVVTRMDVLSRPMLVELKRLLDTMPANKLGFIVAGAETGEGYGYGYGGYRYYRPSSHREKIGASS
jgi:succinoglycan biosynthesis transport protein ExoP